MSTSDGEINIQVNAEGSEDAAAELAEGDDGGGPPGGGGGGGQGLRGNLRAGAIAGALLSAVGPLIDVLDPILKVLQAFLAPVAVLLMRLLQPVLRFLISKVLPAWLDFTANQVPTLLALIGGLPYIIAKQTWGFLKSIPGMTWRAFKSGAGWLTSAPAALGTAIWSKFAGGAAWLRNGASNIGSMVWSNISGWASGLREDVAGLPGDIWNYMKRLPGQIASGITSKVPGLGGGGGGGFLSGLSLPNVGGGGGSGSNLSLSDLRDALGGGGGGDTAIQISGGLGAFVESVEKSSQVDL